MDKIWVSEKMFLNHIPSWYRDTVNSPESELTVYEERSAATQAAKSVLGLYGINNPVVTDIVRGIPPDRVDIEYCIIFKLINDERKES